jgi:NitT/TauT family transport system substrate-binding protein
VSQFSIQSRWKSFKLTKQREIIMRRNLSIPVVALLLGAIVLAACGNAAPLSTAKAKVSIQLGWIYEFSTAEFYTAAKNGRFAAQGLDVDLQPGGFVNGTYVDAVNEVAEGKADFGLTGDYTLVAARAEGKPLVAVGAMLQRNPSAIISLGKTNIRRPQDLVGHKVAVADGGARLLYNALLTTQKIDPTTVNTVPRKTFGIESLLNGEVDAIVGWIINEGVQVRQLGLEPNIILLSDYGIEPYNNVLFTTEKMIKEKPDVVAKFLAAVVQGLQDVLGNPEQAVDHTVAYGKDLKREDQRARLMAMLPLIATSSSKPGMMDDKTWQATYQMEVDQNFLTKPVDITTAYTLTFLKQIYK